MTETTAPATERAVPYRDLSAIALPLVELALLAGLLALKPHYHPRLSWLFLAGAILLVASGTLTALRARRGFTLSPDGLTWHKHQIFVPWSNVTEVVAAGDRVVVKVAETDQLRDARWLGGMTETPWNTRRFGGPIAPKAKRLGIPAAEFVEDAERRRAAYTKSALRSMPRAKGALGSSVLNIAGVALALFAVIFSDPPVEEGLVVQRSGMLVFEYHPGGPDTGFPPRTLVIRNWERLAVAPTLAFTPQDSKGRPVPDVTVRTAFGSDRGLLAVPPRGIAQDALAFEGPRATDVRRVRVTVRGSKYVDLTR
ncbi:hypothetical protein [Actinomadura rupiterrae]|uniref:hypothetical protein n=1 Tax=Actinomadura rupiterrae TaxID=559627 RepID=UPI0020A2FD59|nr:hypothetical protein [Actinomadura rupiterrae]MCP2340223.1 hypothetical protein [Actinomadura rupiterrae]